MTDDYYCCGNGFLLVADQQLCKHDLHYAAMKFLPTAVKNEHISIFVNSHFSRKMRHTGRAVCCYVQILMSDGSCIHDYCMETGLWLVTDRQLYRLDYYIMLQWIFLSTSVKKEYIIFVISHF